MVGVPFNIASYAAFTHLIAHLTNMVPGDFVHTFGDMHLYNNHVEQAKLQLSRTPGKLPRLRINPDLQRLEDLSVEDFIIEDYHPDAAIKLPVAH